MTSSLLSIGSQGVLANQTALSYVGQNITNANTDGYSRQTTSFESRSGTSQGVVVSDVSRIADEFLTRQVWSDTSEAGASEELSDNLSTLDNVLSSDTTSLSAAFDDYFEALQGVVDDPSYSANRQVFLSQAESLANSFNNMYTTLDDQMDTITDQLTSSVSAINSITQSIADLNVQITALTAAGQNTNELLDQRDELVKELSGYIDVDVDETDEGAYNISVGNGQPLVVSGNASTLEVTEGSEDPSLAEVHLLTGSSSDKDITSQLSGGSIGGLLTYRDDELVPAINEVGRLAIVFTQTMNEQHRQGMDLDGDVGEDLFTSETSGVAYPSDDNVSDFEASVSFYDINSLTTSDYRLKMGEDGSFTITRLSDGEVFKSSEMTETSTSSATDSELEGGVYEYTSDGGLTISLDGFTLTLDDVPAQNDTVLVEPTRIGAKDVEVEISDADDLALASALKSTADSDNEGEVEITDITMNTVSDTSEWRQGNLPDYQIEFNDDGTFNIYTVATDGTRTLATDTDGNDMENLTYTRGMTVDMGEFSFTMTNDAEAGDILNITYNTDGVSDNSNAAALSALSDAETVDGYSYQDAYSQLLSWVATDANSASLLNESNQTSLSSSESAVSSVSGVSLDEEATKLVQFQQAYSASAQVISAAQDTFDMLISSMS